ncbi:MAG: hypothetical protein FWC40_05485 [Proteobacteria bacterium]|nr:hypothetical protein [Pseudomonadota bacterium]
MRRLGIGMVIALGAWSWMACGEGASFEKDALCFSCVTRVCEDGGDEAAFARHVASLDEGQRAQIVAMVEAHEGCAPRFDWLEPIAEAVYQTFGRAFFSLEQPYYEARARQAIRTMQGGMHQAEALQYLRHHQVVWSAAPLHTAIESMLWDNVEMPEAFEMLVGLADKAGLEKLSALEPSQLRDKALAVRMADLNTETRQRILGPHVSAQWHMQTSGSVQLPQYLDLVWRMYALPPNFPPIVATLTTTSLLVGRTEARRGGVNARDAFLTEPMTPPNARRMRVDLQPWLTSANTYRIAAKATLQVWPADAPAPCLSGDEACPISPWYEQPVTLDFTYTVYVGVETGAPRRHRDSELNLATTKAVQLSLCHEAACAKIFDTKPVKTSEPLPVRRGHDFYLLVEAAAAPLPLAARLMAREGAGNTWQEVAAFYTDAPQHNALPVRADIDLGDLCPNIGKCSLEVQLRPSLRMARRNPAILRYWGETLELGRVEIENLSRTPAQIWRASKK